MTIRTLRSTPSFAAGRAWLARRERWLWVVVVLALIGDLLLTAHGVSRGYAEANPLARNALAAHGVAGLAGLKLLALGVGVAARWSLPPRYAPVVPLGLACPWLVAVVSNAALIAAG